MQEPFSTGIKRYDVLLFAVASELANCKTISVEASSPTTAIALLEAIGRACPSLIPWLPSCRLAVNQAFVVNDFLITGDVEIALIPPVSGG